MDWLAFVRLAAAVVLDGCAFCPVNTRSFSATGPLPRQGIGCQICVWLVKLPGYRILCILRLGLLLQLRLWLVLRLRFGLVLRLRFWLVFRLRFGLVLRLRFGLVLRLRFGLVLRLRLTKNLPGRLNTW
jgi:hypothetical protein